MPKHRLFAGVLAAALIAGSTSAWACIQPQPASSDATTERVRNHQADLWARSDAVFLSQSQTYGIVDLGGIDGARTTLAPSLMLKGDLSGDGIDIRHTTATSCGPIPMLDALTGAQGDWFVTYVRRLPSGLSVDATVPIAELVDAETLRAWRKAYPIQPLRSAS